MLNFKHIGYSSTSKPYFYFFLLLVQICSSFDSISQCYPENSSFKTGEKLYYNVYYNLGFIKIKLADVRLWIEEGVYNKKKVLVIKNVSTTLPEYDWLIKVNDFYVSYLDEQSMQPLRHVQKTLVDKYSTNNEYRFDYKTNALYASIENSKTKKFIDTLSMNPCLHDLLSAAYFPRNIDYSTLKPGSKVSIPVILDTSIYNIYFKYAGLEIIKTKNNKNLSSIKVIPLLVETSIFKAGEKMMVWFSNDKNKVPVRMESELWIGKILVEIVKYEGLMSPEAY